MNTYSKSFASISDGNLGGVDYPHGGFVAVLSTPSEDRDGERVLRKEWIEPLPDRVPLDVDHGMRVADTIGSFHPYFDGETLMMKAWFADTPKAQEVRNLVRDGHVGGVSVAMLKSTSLKAAGAPWRELLNAGVVCNPCNRDAVILATKAVDALNDALGGNIPAAVKEVVLKALSAEEKGADAEAESVDADDTKDSKKPYGDVEYADPENGKYPIDTEEHVRAALSYIHQRRNEDKYSPEKLAGVEGRIRRRAAELGIHVQDSKSVVYVNVVPRLDEEALKNVVAEVLTKAGSRNSGADAAMLQAVHDASVHLGARCEPAPDPDSGASEGANKSLTVDEFVSAVDETLGLKDSSAEPAAEEAAADVESAAAEEAASDVSEEKKSVSFEDMLSWSKTII